MSDKKTILVLADDIRTPSGVGTQTRYFVETMIKTGRYRLYVLAVRLNTKIIRQLNLKSWAKI